MSKDEHSVALGVAAVLVIGTVIAIVEALKDAREPDPQPVTAEQLGRERADLIRLADGTRCAVTRFGAGIDCDWRSE